MVMDSGKYTALLALTSLLATPTILNAAERPNIVLIMGDDMGFSDLGCYGGEIATPNLNRLADGGVRFSQFYNTARCCPTRASLMTGLYPHQAGVGHMEPDRNHPGYRGRLHRHTPTIAEVLRPAGYRTYMTGKWHLTGGATEPTSSQETWPVQRGFEKFYGTLKGGGSFYDPTSLCRQNTFITPLNDPEYEPETFYYTDAISDNAVRFLQQHAEESAEKPFFLYVAYTAAHWPMHALPDDIAQYRGRFDAGYEPLREARVERLRELGIFNDQWSVSPTAEDWEAVTHQEWETRCMEVYAAMITSMDRGIGRIMKQLEEQGALENTLILFLQDNGGCAETVGRTSNADEIGGKNFPPLGREGLQPRINPPMQTRDGRPIRTGPEAMPGPEDTYIAYGRGWANVSNTPFCEYKHWVHEGGISTPLIAHWPAGIKPSNRWVQEPGHLIDIMATCADLAGARRPQLFGGERVPVWEGASLRPAFTGEPLGRKAPLYWEHEGNRAIRDARWKLVAKENQPWELYDIEADRTEQHDLAATDPQRVRQMAAEWDAWAARANVLPLGTWRGAQAAPPTPAFNPARRFEFQGAAHLAQAQAPMVMDRSITIDVTLTKMGDSGVLVAQGGSAHGYSLYLNQGRLIFALRRNGRLTLIATEDPLPADTNTIRATLNRDELSLTLGEELVSTESPGLLAAMPTEGFDVGRDAGAPVGDYTAPFPFAGQIKSVTIDLREAGDKR
jgi:arylsulfatase